MAANYPVARLSPLTTFTVESSVLPLRCCFGPRLFGIRKLEPRAMAAIDEALGCRAAARRIQVLSTEMAAGAAIVQAARFRHGKASIKILYWIRHGLLCRF
jgi:hypothetical protein